MRPVRLTIVIPTRNRADLVQAAITSVLDQGCADVRVLVSDNSTSEAQQERVAAHVRERNCVEYVAPPQPLAMTDHYQWAMDRALEDPETTHVAYLTDRMVFRRDGVAQLSAILRRHPGRVVTY